MLCNTCSEDSGRSSAVAGSSEPQAADKAVCSIIQDGDFLLLDGLCSNVQCTWINSLDPLATRRREAIDQVYTNQRQSSRSGLWVPGAAEAVAARVLQTRGRVRSKNNGKVALSSPGPLRCAE